MTEMKKRGFTLIELLVVIAIILFLLALMTGVFIRAAQSAKVKATTALIQKIGIALTQYQADFRTLPPDSGFGLAQNGGIVNGQVMYDAATLWRYLSQELNVNGKSYGPYTTFSEYELVPITDQNGKNAFAVVDAWRTPIGYIGDRKRVIHNRDTFDIFSAGPDRKTAINDGIDNDGDGTADAPANRAYDGSGQGTADELGEAALNGCLTAFRKNPKQGEVLDDINNWDPQN
jgi:prepilin-type N-terminal cleavage/methylation domain-containing protein